MQYYEEPWLEIQESISESSSAKGSRMKFEVKLVYVGVPSIQIDVSASTSKLFDAS